MKYGRHIALLVLLAGAVLLLRFGSAVRTNDRPGVREDLPDRIGDWRGVGLLYCANAACGAMVETSGADDPSHCADCGGELSAASPEELRRLPKDTSIAKRRYVDSRGNTLLCYLVVSGVDRGSIHRPELCLTTQGNEITGHSVLPVELPGGGVLRVTRLKITHRVTQEDGAAASYRSFFAYWFIGPLGEETPSHGERLFRMAWDRIIHSTAGRWAYVVVIGTVSEEDADRDLVASFLRALREEIRAVPAPGRDG